MRLGMVEQGDLRAPEAGRAALERTRELLKQAALPPDKADRIGKRIAAIDADLEDQIAHARGTLEGVFPLTRFLTSPLFADSGPTAAYRLIDDPAVKATRDAAADLAAQARELEKKSGQLPVAFIAVAPPSGKSAEDPARQAGQSGQSRPQARAVEHAARRAFRGSPQFLLQTGAAVEDALAPAGKETPPQVCDDFRAGRITTAVAERLIEAFGPRLLVVVIRQNDVVADVCRYRTEGRLLEAGKPRQEAFSTSGFARDRRDRLAWILWANAALLVIAFAAYALIVSTHRGMAGGSSWSTLLALPLVAFVVGRTVPYAFSSLLGSIQLPPGTPALASCWIACLAGLGFLAAPLLVYWLASPWFAGLWPSLSPGNRGGALFAAMGAGIAACLAGPMLLYADKHPAADVLLMSVSVVVLAYLLGRTLDYSDPLPLSLAFVPLILAAPAGAALLHADTLWLAIAATTIVATATAVVGGNAMFRNRRAKARKRNSIDSLAGQARMSGGIPADVQELVRRGKPGVSAVSLL